MKKLLSLIALASVFAACQPEEITTTFDPLKATAKIYVSAKDIASGNDVTSETTFTVSTLPNGIVCTTTDYGFELKGDAILDLKVGFEATWKTFKSDPQDIVINLIPGSVGEYNVTFYVGVQQVDPSTVLYLGNPTELSRKVEKFYLNNTHYESHAHDGGNWFLNPSEFILTGEVAYKSVMSSEVKDIKVKENAPEYSNAVATIGANVKSTDFYEEKSCTLPIQVSAFAMYTAWQETCTLVQEFDVIAETYGGEKTVGTITIETISYSSAQYEEMPCPGHESHYVHGHGHDDVHGGHSNAGGGIVVGE